MASIGAITDFISADIQQRATVRAAAAISELSPSAAQPLFEAVGTNFDRLADAAAEIAAPAPTLDGTGRIVDTSV
ncbi:MAG: hypothetical protein AAGE89_07600 [Pseudomonadota bacterium]